MASSTFFWGDRTWGAGDQAAFAKWLQRHGVTYTSWARNHPAAAAILGGGSSSAGGGSAAAASTPFQTASDEARAEIQAQIDAVNQERQRAAESNQRTAQNMTGFYSALAGMLKGIGPATASTYANATSQEAAIGKGFSDAQAAIQSGEATDMTSFLTKIGAPQEQVKQVLDKVGGPGASDVVYGLGAAIPATALNREGAAFTAAADMLPATGAKMGMENLRGLESDFAKTNQGYDDRVSQILGTLPKTTQDLLQQWLENNRAERALQVQEGYYGQSNLKTGAELTGKLPNGQPTYAAQQDAAKKAADAKASRQKAIQDREAAFDAARQDIFKQAHGLVQPMTIDDKVAWVAAHASEGKSFADAPNTKPVDYAAAKKALFNQYKDLLRYATASGKAALKRRLNQMIDEALAAAGIHPTTAPKKSKTVKLPLGLGAYTQLPAGG